MKGHAHACNNIVFVVTDFVIFYVRFTKDIFGLKDFKRRCNFYLECENI